MTQDSKNEIHFIGNMEKEEALEFVLKYRFGRAVVMAEPQHDNPDIAKELSGKGMVGLFDISPGGMG